MTVHISKAGQEARTNVLGIDNDGLLHFNRIRVVAPLIKEPFITRLANVFKNPDRGKIPVRIVIIKDGKELFYHDTEELPVRGHVEVYLEW